MTGVKIGRRLLYVHLAIATTCVALAILVLRRRAAGDWEFIRQIEDVFSFPLVPVLWATLLASMIAFPIALLLVAVRYQLGWRFRLAAVAGTVLTMVEYLALFVLLPYRE
jgi:hypothetical protein